MLSHTNVASNSKCLCALSEDLQCQMTQLDLGAPDTETVSASRWPMIVTTFISS